MTTVRSLNVEPLLLGGRPYECEDLDGYRAAGGYADAVTSTDLLARIDATNLRGRGGAGFPLATKLKSVAAQPTSPIVVANGEEGEPGSIKDRHLMRTRPHLILDGLARAAAMVGAERGYVYLSDPIAAGTIREALVEHAQPIDVTVVEVARTYVAGEETALVRFLDGGPALPVAKPPRPFEYGVGGAPTLISNVETLAHVALLASGIDATGHLLITLAGSGIEPQLIEASSRTALHDLLPDTEFALVGGMFGGLAPIGTGHLIGPMGHGTIYALSGGDCPIDVAADALAYLAAESSRQCGVCVSGTRSLADAVAAMRDGTATETHVANVARWATGLPGRGACGLLDAAARIAGSLGMHCAEPVAAHLDRACPTCTDSTRSGGARFFVSPMELARRNA